MKPKRAVVRSSTAAPTSGGSKVLLTDVREMILAARHSVAQTMNATLTTLYWQIGRRIRRDILQEKRAEYGERIVSALGTQLTREFGRGFNTRNLFRMIRFAEVFPQLKIVSALRTQLGWTHFRKDLSNVIQTSATCY